MQRFGATIPRNEVAVCNCARRTLQQCRTYALPAYAGQLTADNKTRINAISTKAMRRGLTLTSFDIDAC